MNQLIGLLLMLSLLSACATPATAIPPQPSPIAPTLSPTPMPTETPMPTPTAAPRPLITSIDEAVAFAQRQYPNLKDIKSTPQGTLGASTNIISQETAEGWNLIFWKGEGDCPAGCINNYYWYISVNKFGAAKLEGEYAREYNAHSNAFQTRGQPLWGVPQ
jgi:hypothetical protein